MKVDRQAFQNLSIIGDRINPGFKATRVLVEEEDIKGIQDLAIRQVDAGATILDVTIGPRGYDDPKFLTEVIQAIQSAVDVPLCFDYPKLEVQEVCLKAYDPDKAGGQFPLVNSIAETRWEFVDLFKICPFKVVLMASERMENGAGVANKESSDVLLTAKRSTAILLRDHGLQPDDIYIDVTISTLASDTEGMVKMGLDAIKLIGNDPDLKGVHIVGGLTNIGNLLPPVDYAGMRLRHAMESAFLTVAVPLGFDTVLGTPWNDFQILADDNEVLQTFREVVDLTGMDAIRRLRQLWSKKSS
jgi:5-methyltetrahydrofolate--homocysteine methyltransferase